MLGVYKNIKGKRFEKKDVFGKYGSYMGVAVGDIDQDGDQDYYISNIGNTIKVSKTTRGNLKDDEVLSHDHIILRNDGKFKFTEIGKKMGINNAGFSWGANFIDFNLDTYLDLLVAQNFTEIATHQLAPLPGQRWKYDPNIKKYVKEDKYKNPHYGQAPLSIDVDGDGIKDIVWINMKNPIKIYKGTKPENNNYINISLPNDIRFANAQVEVKTNNKIYTKEYIIGGTGFGSKMSSILQFGLGEIKKIDKVRIKTIYGNIYTYNKPKINSTLIIKT